MRVPELVTRLKMAKPEVGRFRGGSVGFLKLEKKKSVEEIHCAWVSDPNEWAPEIKSLFLAAPLSSPPPLLELRRRRWFWIKPSIYGPWSTEIWSDGWKVSETGEAAFGIREFLCSFVYEPLIFNPTEKNTHLAFFLFLFSFSQCITYLNIEFSCFKIICIKLRR